MHIRTAVSFQVAPCRDERCLVSNAQRENHDQKLKSITAAVKSFPGNILCLAQDVFPVFGLMLLQTLDVRLYCHHYDLQNAA